MKILLPVILLLSWFFFALTLQGKIAIEDEMNGIPKDKRRGTSILPLFPIIPLVLWSIAWLLDRVISPWGSWSFLILHSILLLASIFIITRDTFRLRRIIKSKLEQRGACDGN